MIHHEGSDKMYMSEEMIGAYLEGKLAPHDAHYVESLMARNSDLSSLVDDCKEFKDAYEKNLYQDSVSFTGLDNSISNLDNSFPIPEIPLDLNASVDLGIIPFSLDLIDFFDNYNDSIGVSANSLNDGIGTITSSLDGSNSLNGVGGDGFKNEGINNIEY